MRTKVIIIAIVLYLLSSLPFVYAGEGTVSEKISKYRTGIFHVGQSVEEKGKKGVQWLGTAFLLDDCCTFATAKHIFKKADRKKIVIRFVVPKDKTKIKTLGARILYEDPVSDLAFLKVDKLGNQPCRSGSLYSFPTPSHFVKGSFVGEPVFIIGHPSLFRGENIDFSIVRRGIVSSTEIKWKEQPMVLLDLIGVPGFSGSPVIHERTGQAIGVVFGPGPTRRNFGFEWATPITRNDYLKALSNSDSEEQGDEDSSSRETVKNREK